jgi:hypothetical protein
MWATDSRGTVEEGAVCCFLRFFFFFFVVLFVVSNGIYGVGMDVCCIILESLEISKFR